MRSAHFKVIRPCRGLPSRYPGPPESVGRNRARRRLRAAIAPLLMEHPGLDMVVSLPGRATEMPFTSLRDALAAALSSASGAALLRART